MSSSKKRSEFEFIYPIVLFIYFFVVLTFTMFFMHPVFLALSFISAFLYLFLLKGKKAVLTAFSAVYVILFSAIFNTLFNHQGVTILFYLLDNPITLESFIYGIFSGIMFSCIILWFSIFNVIVTSEKIIFAASKVFPAAALTFTLALRFVPRFFNEIKEINKSIKSIKIGVKEKNGTKDKIKDGISVLSVMISWALESSVETANSMNSRGFGLRKRTFFSKFNVESIDKICFFVIFICTAIICRNLAGEMVVITFFPYFKVELKNYFGITAFLSYGIICFLPIILDLAGEFKWKYLR